MTRTRSYITLVVLCTYIMPHGCHSDVDCGTVTYSEHITNLTFYRKMLPIPPTGRIKFNYSFVFSRDQCCPIVSIETNKTLHLNNHRHHVHNCYKENIGNILLTSQLYIYLKPAYEYSGCKLVGDYYFCNSLREYYIGYEDNWWIDIGYKCNNRQTLNVTFHADLQCSYQVVCAKLVSDYCRSELHYDSTAFPNTLGYSSQQDANVLLQAAILAFGWTHECYRYSKEFMCYSFFPKCHKGRPVIPCRETCVEGVTACREHLDRFDQPLYCGSYPSMHDNQLCFYKPVICSPLNAPEFGTVVQDGYNVSNTTRYSCHKGYTLHGDWERHCMPSALWNGTAPTCIPQSGSQYIAIVTILLVLLIMIAIMIVLCVCYRREIKLRIIHNSFLSRKMYKVNEDSHQLFVSFSTLDLPRLESILLPAMKQEVFNWKIVTYQESFRADRTIVYNMAQVIRESKAAIVLLTQNYLDSEWCTHEFIELQTRSVKDTKFTLIVILFEEGVDDKGAIQFNNNLPPTMWTWIKTRIYLRLGEPLFWNKLRRGLAKKRTT